MDGGNSDVFDEDPRITSVAIDSLNGLVLHILIIYKMDVYNTLKLGKYFG